MVDGVNSAPHQDLREVERKIKEAARKIKVAVVVAKQNGEKCRQIEKRVDRVVAMLDWLAKSKTARKAAIRSDLEDLHDTLDLALKLVTGCHQEKKVTCLRSFAAGNLSKRLGQVNRNIRESIARLANNVHNNILLGTQKLQDGFPPAPQEDAAEESSRHKGDDTRSEGKDGETNDAGGREDAQTSQGFEDYKILFMRAFEYYKLSYLREITNDFEEVVREDCWSRTYKGILPNNGGMVAVRRFDVTIQIMSSTYLRVLSVIGHHENVVRCLGFCYDKEEVPVYFSGKEVIAVQLHDLVVEEYYPRGTLDTYLDDNQLDWSLRFQVIRGIAEGVAHFHTKNVIHLELCLQNIFLDANMKPKICGFERSKIVDEWFTEAETVSRGMIGYVALEYLTRGIVSVKTDVYSFGVILLRVVTAKTGCNFWTLGEDLEEIIKELLCGPSKFNESQTKTFRQYVKIGQMCIEEKPEDRLSCMSDILKMLDSEEISPTPKNSRSEPAVPPSSATEHNFAALVEATTYFSEKTLIGDSHVAAVYEDAVEENSCQPSDDTRRLLNGNVRSQVKDRETSEGHEVSHISAGYEEYKLSYLREITNEFDPSHKIGSDSWTTAYKGILHDGCVVVIKRIHNNVGATQQAANIYVQVLSLMGDHENVVRCLGFCHETNEARAYFSGKELMAVQTDDLVVEEYYPRGRLDKYIDDNQLNWFLKFQLIRGIANGVAHFHTKNVIHLGLRPGNILLDANMTPKICGFETSKLLDQGRTETRTDELVGTMHYMAPEYVRSGIVSVKNDVYSFGVLLLYVVTGKIDREVWALGARDLDECMAISYGDECTIYLPDITESDEKMTKGCIMIGLMCTEEEPEDRPSMFEILDMLDGRKEILPIPKRDKNAAIGPADSPSSVTEFTFAALEAATDYFSQENLIGDSHIATVYKGELKNKVMVAIKKFHVPWGPRSIKLYKNLPSFQHENIARFLGYCEESGKEMVVEEYLPSRSLSNIINGPQGMDWPSRFQIIRGVANALRYLHSKSIVHFDLTPANIVIFDTHMNPKICDFGLCKIVDGSGQEKGTKEFEITAGSAAPEYADGVISVKNDVYSFGDLVCTLSGMSRSGPPQDLNDVAMVVRVARQMKELFDPSSCTETQLKQIKECMDIGLRCTRMERRRRPTMEDVLEILNKTDNKVSSKTKS